MTIAVLAVMSLSPAAAQPGAAETVTAETTKSSTGGAATFKVPARWSVRSTASAVVLQPPETDTHVAIVETKATDPAAAVAAAWQSYRPGFARPLKLTTDRPGRDGWEALRVFEYETSPNERAVVVAQALRLGKAWTVFLLEGTEPTVEKRSAPIGMIRGSLRPSGYERESFASRKALPLTPERVAAMKQFVEQGMKTLSIPGVAIALTENGKVVFEGGFGVRELGGATPVDANTLFMAASNTKGMTTLLLAKLADQKKLRWDQQVTSLYPSFRLGSPEVTRQVLIKHLVCACTGLPRQDMEWIFEFRNATPASSMALLGTMQPTSKFGEVFQYSNMMASAAGYAGAHLYAPGKELGAAYDTAMQELIFGPLGMNSTTFDMARAQKGNHARPHGLDVDGRQAVARMDFNYSIMPHRPAGGVWTSAHDLIRYVQLELGRGMLDGKRIVSEENITERRKPQVSTGEQTSYGMGLSISERNDVKVVSHGGSLAGYKSDLLYLPDHGVGAVILTNSDTGGMLLGPFRRRLLEILFDGRPEASGNLESSAASLKARIAKERERLTAPAAETETSQLAARYRSDALGQIDIRKKAGSTVFDFGEWSSAVASRKNDDGTMSFVTIDPTVEWLEFVRAERGGRRALILRDAQHEYVFTEAAASQ
jgi:CubicO group peptidase (beta-lactamase class C family)